MGKPEGMQDDNFCNRMVAFLVYIHYNTDHGSDIFDFEVYFLVCIGRCCDFQPSNRLIVH